MSITASELIALVSVSGAKEASVQLLGVGSASDDAGAKLKNLTIGATLIAGAALVGVGIASLKMAGDFQQSTNLLITSAGETTRNIGMIRAGLLQMSVDTATPVDALVKGMFNVESASYHGAAALLVEQAAAEGAKVENADLADTTGILVTAMHDFHEPASQAVDVMNSFRMAASMGVMHLDDLNAALKNVLPIASAAGVKLTDVEAAISTMSLAGDKGASAGTHLSQMLTYLLAPSSKATSALKEVGLTTQQISDEMKVSLPGTVQMITDAVGEKFPVGSAKYIAALSAIVGGNKSMKAILELSGISLKTFTQDAEQLAPTLKANSTAVDGWSIVQGNFNFKLEAAKNAVSALMIEIGTALLPVVSHLLDVITPAITTFSKWVTSGHAIADVMGFISQHAQTMVPLLAGAGALIGGLLVAAFASLAISAGSAAVAVIAATWPFLLIGAAVAGLAALFVHFYQTSAPLRTVIQQIGEAFQTVFEPIKQVSQAVHPLLDTFDRATGIFHNTASAAKPLLDTFDRAPGVLKPITDTTKPMLDTFDRATGVFQKTSGSAHGVTQAVNPFIAIFKQVASVVQGTIAVFEWVAGAVHTTIDIFNMLRPTLAGIGSFLASNFMPVWKQLVDLWNQQLLPLGKQLWAALQPLMPLFIGLAELVGVVLVVALGLLVGLLAGLIKGLAGFLSGLVIVIQGIVQLFTGVIQVVAGIIRVIIDLVTLNFSDLGPALGEIWQGIINIFAGAWTIIAGLFLTAWFTISGIVVGFVQGIIGFFTTLYNDLVGHSIIPDMVNGIINWFMSLVARGIALITHLVTMILVAMVRLEVEVLQTISLMVSIFLSWLDHMTGGAVTRAQSVVSGITGILGKLPGMALQWGMDMINSFIQGIKNAAAGVGNVVSGVVSTIAGLLHHSKPDYGPLANDDQWMPDMMNMFASGIESGVPKIQAALSKVTKPLAVNLNPSSSAFAGGSLQLPSLAAASGGNHSFSIPIYIGADEVAEYLVDPVMGKATRKTRLRHGRRTF